ncbi:MAG: hypothetical protein NTW52_07980 [Planctomycetota bacterium]|nr:hypothetical protein [Planctomycetota bacterium]
MDRQTLIDEVRQGSVLVFMKDGTSHKIPTIENYLVDQIAA